MKRSIWDVELQEGDRVKLRDPDTPLDRALVGVVWSIRSTGIGGVRVMWDDGGEERLHPDDLRVLDAVERLAELA